MNLITGRCPNCLQENSIFPCTRCGWQEGQDNSPPLLSIGTILDGRYRIARVLGQGGFGVTYLAWEENLQQRLAIKEYFPRDAATRAVDGMSLSVYTGISEDLFAYGLERFLEEARILAKFDRHPGVVSAKNFFRANGTGYMVMEYVEGITMRQYLERCPEKRIPIERAIVLLMPVMNALQAVHKEGLLHRDIAPDNIYITLDKQVKLLDFGAARHATGEQTKSLSVILKPGYAPEEQYRSRGKQGPWTDVYALAATLYRAITGRVPPESLDRLNEDDLVPPSFQGVGLLPHRESVLLKALSVKASERYQSMADFQLALRGEGLAINPNSAYTEPTIQVPMLSSNDLENQTTRVVNVDQPTSKVPYQKPITEIISKPNRLNININHWILPGLGVALTSVIIAGSWYLFKLQPPRLQNASISTSTTPTNLKWSVPQLTKSEPTSETTLSTAPLRASANEPEMVTLPAGCYQIGSANMDNEHKENERLHQVCVNAFNMSTHEVTNREFRIFEPNHDSKDHNGNSLNGDDQPVVAVSWGDAQAYAQWLSNQTGKLYRLPTEAEWEYSARAGTSTSRFWGDDSSTACAYANVNDQTSKRINAFDWDIHNCDDKYAVTAPVGTYQPNAWGLYDMLGNVWEWTCSAYSSTYDGSELRCADSTQTNTIAVRGGSWASSAGDARAASRSEWSPNNRLDGLGFRLVQD